MALARTQQGRAAARLLVLGFLAANHRVADAFVTTRAFAPSHRSRSSRDALPHHHAVSDALDALPVLPTLTLGQELLEEGLGGSVVDVPSQATFDALTSGSGGGGGVAESVLGAVRTVLVFFTALAFAAAGLSLVFAAFLIPKAAEQLEKETKELAPELWDEYQSKLGEGETLAQRPDLLKELGDKVQPLIDAKIANAYKEQLAENEKVMEDLPPPLFPPEGQKGGVIDVEVTKEEGGSKEGKKE